MAREPLGVVLTAGLGTRLRPITPATPKPLVPLLNRPLIVYALELLASLGLREIAVVVGPEDASTVEVARRQAPPGVEVSEAVQREPNGPGDALASVGAALEDRTVAVLAVDTVLRGADPALLRRFEDSGATAGLLLQAVEDPRAFGVALLEGERIVDLEEKPEQPRSNLALVGLWLLAPEAVERVRTNPYINAKGESDLTATVAALLGEGRDLRGWTLDGEWLDGGTLEGLLHAQSRLLPGIEADSGAGRCLGARGRRQRGQRRSDRRRGRARPRIAHRRPGADRRARDGRGLQPRGDGRRRQRRDRGRRAHSRPRRAGRAAARRQLRRRRRDRRRRDRRSGPRGWVGSSGPLMLAVFSPGETPPVC